MNCRTFSLAALFIFASLPVLRAEESSVPKLDPRGPVAQGKPYKSANDGAEIVIPDGWVYRETETGLVLGSNTEPGLIVVWVSQAKLPEAVDREMSEALASTGGTFGKLEGRQSVTLTGGETTVAEATGKDAQGVSLRARLLAVAGKDVTVMVAGLTTNESEKMNGIRRRTDSMARSVKFVPVDRTQAKGLIAGQWWSYKAATGISGGGGGSERTVAFCPDGRYLEKSESGYYGSGWGTAGSGGGAGKWTASGTEKNGSVRVINSDGSTTDYSYKAKGPNDISLNGRDYGRVAASLCQ